MSEKINNKAFCIHGDSKKKKKLCATIHPLTINENDNQNIKKYKNDTKLEDVIKNNTIIKKKILEKKEKINYKYPKINIAIAFHVIYPKKKDNDDNFNISDKRIDLQIDALNGEYNPIESTQSFGYKISQPGYLSEGNTISGITFYNYKNNGGAYSRTENNDWFYNTEENERDIKKKLSIDPNNIINIYISEANGYLGWAHFPYDFSEGHYMHGLVISNTTIPKSNDEHYKYGRTCIHEMGHYLGLYHTFQDGCKNNDGCDDTPAQYDGDNIYDCEFVNTCRNNKGLDPVKNYMNYTDDLCLTHFTDDQFKRIWSNLEIYKPNLIKNNLIQQNKIFKINLNKGWNLVSIPFNVTDFSKLSNKIIYYYDRSKGYIKPTNIKIFTPYWIKSNIKEDIELNYFEDETTVSNNINVFIGWNLISSIKYKSNLVTDLDIDICYNFSDGVYNEVSPVTLYPGESYWIKLSSKNRNDIKQYNLHFVKS